MLKMNSNCIYFLSFLTVGTSFCSAQTQSLKLYNSTDCSGMAQETVTNSVSFTIPSSETIKSIHTVGMWRVNQQDLDGTIFYSGDAEGTCRSSFTPMSGTIDIRMHGDSAMKNFTSITFHTLPYFGGDEYKISHFSPNTAINMKSYWCTGTHNTWVVYMGVNYTGIATCLTPSDTVKQKGWGHTFEFNRPINIRSFKRFTTCPSVNGGSSISALLGVVCSTTLFAFISIILLH